MASLIRLAATVMLALSLAGCGSYGAITSCKNGKECAAYALVTEGNASGLFSHITGEAATCKVTAFGNVSEWQVVYKGERCEAYLNEIP